MLFSRGDVVRGSAIGLVCAAGGAVVAIPFLLWGSGKAPEFFGAFTAAIVAAVAVVLGAHYQSELTRQRDEDNRKRDQTGEIMALYFWLGHAAREMEFIADVLCRMHTKMVEAAQSHLQLPFEQFREIISAHFMDELLMRAQTASRLPFDVAIPVAHVLYGTYTETDRIYRLRGASTDHLSSIEEIEKLANLARARVTKLEDAASQIETYICTAKGVSRFLGG